MKFNGIKISCYIILAALSFGFSGREVMAIERVFEELEAVISPADTQPVTDSTLVGPPNTFGRYIETPEYSGYVLPLFAEPMYSYCSYLWMYPSFEWNLSDEDVALAEEILRGKLKECCLAKWATVPEELTDLNIFIRQYIGRYQPYGKFKGNRTVFINLVKKDDYKNYKDFKMTNADPMSKKGFIYEEWISGAYDYVYEKYWENLDAISIYIDLNKRCIIGI